MSTCGFFGHRDTPATSDLEERLEELAERLIKSGVDEFYVCEQGNFDWLSRIVMHKLAEKYPNIRVCYVCAYDPSKYSKTRQNYLYDNFFDVIYIDELATIPPRFAIERRNKYIGEQSDYIICYVEYASGGAYKAVKHAEKMGAKIFNLAKSDLFN